MPLLSAAAISTSRTWASVSNAPKAKIIGASTNTTIAIVNSSAVTLGPMRGAARTANRL